MSKSNNMSTNNTAEPVTVTKIKLICINDLHKRISICSKLLQPSGLVLFTRFSRHLFVSFSSSSPPPRFTFYRHFLQSPLFFFFQPFTPIAFLPLTYIIEQTHIYLLQSLLNVHGYSYCCILDDYQ